MSFEDKIRNYTNSILISLETHNWYSALFVALTLPDICGKYQYPKVKGSGKRYSLWFDKYLLHLYTMTFRDETQVFLSGDDCYALRCSFLHEGSSEITHQNAREVLNNYMFVYPVQNSFPTHNNFLTINGTKTLQLQVDIFCKEICDAVETWLRDIENDQSIKSKDNELLLIQSPVIMF